MAEFGGNNFTQLTYLNIEEELRVQGIVVTSGNGDVLGPATSTINALSRWNDTTGELLADTGLMIDANNNISFTPVAALVGIDWDPDITMMVNNVSDVLSTVTINNATNETLGWDLDGMTDSTKRTQITQNADALVLGTSVWDGAGAETSSSNITLTTSSFLITDGNNSKGLEYAADYSGAFTARSIVDKAYVDSVAGDVVGPVTSTLTGISRWGDATGDSLLDSGVLIDANNNMFFTLQGAETTVGIWWDDGAENIRQYYDSAGLGSVISDAMAEGQFNFFAWNNDGEANSDNQGVFLVQDSAVSVGVATWDGAGSQTGTSEIVFKPATNAMLVTDSILSEGLTYAADYSGNWTARSIVDKEYVDAIGGGEVVKGQGSVPITVEISDAEIAAGGKFIIKDETGTCDTGGDEITVTTESAQTIDGEVSIEIAVNYGAVRLYSDGSNLFSW